VTATRVVARVRRVVGLDDIEKRCVLGVPLLGRAIDGLGKALDGLPLPRGRRTAGARALLPAERAPL
jgi:flagellar biosynthesis/type III secretory pathway ATPase